MKKKVIAVVKDLDIKKREVKFAFSLFNEYDSDKDITMQGAFKKSIAENGPSGTGRIKHAYNHEIKTVPLIGTLKEMGETNEYAYAVSKMMNHEFASAVLEGYEEGAIKEHSYWGMALIKGRNDEGGHVIKEVALKEVSTVPWGAQEKAKLLALGKGEIKNIKDLESFKEHLEGLARWVKKSKATDDIIFDLETEILKSIEILDTLEMEGRQEAPETFKPLSLAEIYSIT